MFGSSGFWLFGKQQWSTEDKENEDKGRGKKDILKQQQQQEQEKEKQKQQQQRTENENANENENGKEKQDNGNKNNNEEKDDSQGVLGKDWEALYACLSNIQRIDANTRGELLKFAKIISQKFPQLSGLNGNGNNLNNINGLLKPNGTQNSMDEKVSQLCNQFVLKPSKVKIRNDICMNGDGNLNKVCNVKTSSNLNNKREFEEQTTVDMNKL